MIKIKVTESVSDWFHTVDKTIDETQYTFRLRAENLVWMLEGFQNGAREIYYQVEQPRKLIDQLGINEIIGNRYCTVQQLLRR